VCLSRQGGRSRAANVYIDCLTSSSSLSDFLHCLPINRPKGRAHGYEVRFHLDVRRLPRHGGDSGDSPRLAGTRHACREGQGPMAIRRERGVMIGSLNRRSQPCPRGRSLASIHEQTARWRPSWVSRLAQSPSRQAEPGFPGRPARTGHKDGHYPTREIAIWCAERGKQIETLA